MSVNPLLLRWAITLSLVPSIVMSGTVRMSTFAMALGGMTVLVPSPEYPEESPHMLMEGSNRYCVIISSFVPSPLNFATPRSLRNAFASNAGATFLMSSRSSSSGGLTSSSIPSTAGAWSSSTRVDRAWTSLHAGLWTHDASPLCTSPDMGPPVSGFPSATRSK